MFTFPDHAYSVIRLRGADGADLTEGYRLTEETSVRVTGLSVIRDASSLLAHTTLTSDGGRGVTLSSRHRHGGFWLPMGWERY